MTFRNDVEAVLPGAYAEGLRALSPADRRRVSARDTRTISGSANIDAALAAVDPGEPRWDYAIGQKRSHRERIHWVEVHPASGRACIEQVEAKLRWLVRWLRSSLLGGYPRTIVWIATGRSAFNARDPAIKRLAQHGCQFVGRNLSIP